jgi:hypothetical protein
MGAKTYLKRHNKKRYFVDLKKNTFNTGMES